MRRRQDHLVPRLDQAGEDERHRARRAWVTSTRSGSTDAENRASRSPQSPHGVPRGHGCRCSSYRPGPEPPPPGSRRRAARIRAPQLEMGDRAAAVRARRAPGLHRERGRAIRRGHSSAVAGKFGSWATRDGGMPPVSPTATDRQGSETSKCLKTKPFSAKPPLTHPQAKATVGGFFRTGRALTTASNPLDRRASPVHADAPPEQPAKRGRPRLFDEDAGDFHVQGCPDVSVPPPSLPCSAGGA